MSMVGIKELKDRLPYYLRRTKQGEEIIVTERGKPVAVIQQIQSAKKIVSLEARLAQLAAQGTVTLAKRKPTKKIRRAKVSGVPISQLILEERR